MMTEGVYNGVLKSKILFVMGSVAGPIRDFDDESYPQSSQVRRPLASFPPFISSLSRRKVFHKTCHTL